MAASPPRPGEGSTGGWTLARLTLVCTAQLGGHDAPRGPWERHLGWGPCVHVRPSGRPGHLVPPSTRVTPRRPGRNSAPTRGPRGLPALLERRRKPAGRGQAGTSGAACGLCGWLRGFGLRVPASGESVARVLAGRRVGAAREAGWRRALPGRASLERQAQHVKLRPGSLGLGAGGRTHARVHSALPARNARGLSPQRPAEIKPGTGERRQGEEAGRGRARRSGAFS